MQFTNRQIVESLKALQSLGAKELPIQLSFKIGRNLRKFSEAHKDYETSHASLINKHAVKEEDGSLSQGDIQGTVKIKDGQAFNAESEQLLAVTVDVDVLTVTLADFGNDKLAPGIFAALDWMITPSATL